MRGLMDCDSKKDHKETDNSIDDAHISPEVIYSISASLRKGEIVELASKKKGQAGFLGSSRLS